MKPLLALRLLGISYESKHPAQRIGQSAKQHKEQLLRLRGQLFHRDIQNDVYLFLPGSRGYAGIDQLLEYFLIDPELLQQGRRPLGRDSGPGIGLDRNRRKLRQIDAFFDIVMIGKSGLKPCPVSVMIISMEAFRNDVMMRKKGAAQPREIRRLKHASAQHRFP